MANGRETESEVLNTPTKIEVFTVDVQEVFIDRSSTPGHDENAQECSITNNVKEEVRDVFVPRNDESSNESTILQIVIPTPGRSKRKSDEMDIDKEIEGDIQRELECKAKKTNLTVKNVKSILRYVIGNESVLAMVKNAMRDSGAADDLGFEPKLTRSKIRQLREKKHILWPLSPIHPPAQEQDNNEHLVLIREELPEEEDDEEYRPSHDDLQEHSDDETGIRSVASSCDVSFTSQVVESIDSQQMNNRTTVEPDPQVQHLEPFPTACSTFKRPRENIGQRTRSKLSLSSTPLEAIEQAFIPPDITTDMYDYKCDNQEWENFLKEFMQPLSNDCTDVDEEDDPEYNILAEEEVVDQEELRRDRGVHISRAELRTLMMELLELPDEHSSDEDVSISKIPNDKVIDAPEEVTEISEPEPLPSEPEIIGVTSSQQLLLQQQLRQHIQLLVQHFIQTNQHPLFSNDSRKCKILLAELVELGNLNPKSVCNVFNLKAGFELVKKWEELLLSDEGDDVHKHILRNMVLAKEAKSKRSRHQTSFHPILMNFIARSKVFLYPLLLPHQPFRCDNPVRLEFVDAEDQLIALGLEEFVPYVQKYPNWSAGRQGDVRCAADYIHELLVSCKTTVQIYHRIRMAQHNKLNKSPIWYYHKTGRAPQTMHYVIPFDFFNVKTPREQDPRLLPESWKCINIYHETD